MSEQKITPFESFSKVYNLLLWAGYFGLLKKPKYKCLWVCHQIYRLLAFLLAVTFNAVHLIFIIQVEFESYLQVSKCLNTLDGPSCPYTKAMRMVGELARLPKITRPRNSLIY